MRWDELFADIEGQLEQELDAERLDLVAEEERLRLGRLSLRERLVAISREPGEVRIDLVNGDALELRIDSIGRDWMAGDSTRGEHRRQVVVPLRAIGAVLPHGDQLDRGLRPVPPEPGAELAGRLGLSFVLRDLCRRRSAVQVSTMLGTHHGTIDRVGRDHLDLAEHEPGTPRRAAQVRCVRLIPFEALLVIRM